MKRKWTTNYALGIFGAFIGGVVGYFAFKLLMSNGFYALALPGAMIGIGCGLLSRIHSRPLGFFCSIAALATGVGIEWHIRPFVADESLSYFVTHLHQLNVVTIIMLVLGVLGAFWFGIGRAKTA